MKELREMLRQASLELCHFNNSRVKFLMEELSSMGVYNKQTFMDIFTPYFTGDPWDNPAYSKKTFSIMDNMILEKVFNKLKEEEEK